MEQAKNTGVPTVDDATLAGWQSLVDLMAEICKVPTGLIMRITGPDIEVFVASRTKGNPYHVGDHEKLAGSGLYCEHVVKTKSPLHIPDARANKHWCSNPDIKLNMIAYHGHPILAPSGTVFGTICILDQKPYELGPLYDRFISLLKGHIEQDLHSIAAAEELAKRNAELSHALSRIHTLEGILPICSRCKKIRLQGEDARDPAAWVPMESYIGSHSHAQFSHGMCPACIQEFYGDQGKGVGPIN